MGAMSERVPAISSPGYGPVLLVLISAMMWGLWWVPIRICEALGLTGVWPNFGINLGALLGLLVVVLAGRAIPKLTGPALLGATLIGMAVAFYGASLSLTDVVRAVLLFYLAPAWSTLIEVIFLGRRWHWKRLPPLILSFAGMIVVFRGEIALDNGGIGDLIALLSGMAWSIGAALVFSTKPNDVNHEQRSEVASLSLAVMVSAVITSLVMLPLKWQGWPDPSGDAFALAVPLALGTGVLYLAPIIGITLWGARKLLPATISFLLAAEIISGVTSSAFFLDEPFGWWEAGGTIMIITSVIAHVALDDSSRTQTA